MEKQRGQRQASRTRVAIEGAFRELMFEKGYVDITVNDITERADVGRSTFYRHYQSKADLMVAMHGLVFERLFAKSRNIDDWLSDDPHQEIVEFFKRFENRCPADFSLSQTLGADSDYIFRNVIDLLAESVTSGLNAAFCRLDKPARESAKLVAASIAGTYGWVFISWKKNFPEMSAEDLARHIQRIVHGIVQAGL